MEMFGILFGGMFFTAVILSWFLICRWRKFSRTVLIIGIVFLLIPPLLGAASLCVWMFIDEPQTIALIEASEQGDLTQVQAVLNKGASPNFDFEGTRPLAGAAKNGHTEIVRVLLSHGADPNADSFGAFPLELAASEGHTEIVRILLAHGVRVNSVSHYNNRTPLASAKANGHTEIVKLLKQAGAVK